jgi:hypothetical protein
MAVSIDTVYQRVLALANKEQRGYITPQEFNLFANHAQMEIFEQYFYDLNQAARVPGNNKVIADVDDMLEEKISIFEVVVGSGTVTSWGLDGQNIIIPSEVYRLSEVRVSSFPVEFLSTKEFNMARESPLTAPTETRPIARRDFKGILIHNGSIVTPLTHSINSSYIKKPTKVEWAYVVVNNKPLYNDNISVSFELHPSEETELVHKILKLAGVNLKAPDVVQVGQALEQIQTQQEKQ